MHFFKQSCFCDFSAAQQIARNHPQEPKDAPDFVGFGGFLTFFCCQKLDAPLFSSFYLCTGRPRVPIFVVVGVSVCCVVSCTLTFGLLRGVGDVLFASLRVAFLCVSGLLDMV